MQKSLPSLFEQFQQGKYTFEDFVSTKMSVNETLVDGKFVAVPDPLLRAIHLFIDRSVIAHLNFHRDVVFSYRKGKTIYDAVKPHVENSYFYKTDLKNFFGSITIQHVREILIRNREYFSFSEPERYIERLSQLLTFKGALPPGFSTSPGLSNACLIDFDEAFNRFAIDNGVTYTRYSDDIIISGTSYEVVHRSAETVDFTLAKVYGNAFETNKSKSKHLGFGQKVSLLGLTVSPNHTLSLDSHLRKRVETLIYSYLTDPVKFLKYSKKKTAAQAERHLAGHISFIHTVDKPYLSKLRRKFGSGVVERFLRLPLQ